MDAKTGTNFLIYLRLQQILNEADVVKAIEIAGSTSPSRAFKDAQLHASLYLRRADKMQHLTFAKGVRWLAMLRRDEGNEIFAIYALQLAIETNTLIDEILFKKLPLTGVRKSATLAYRKHAGQFRLGGERHFDHVLRVALASAFHHIQIGASLAEIVESFQAGVLHDTIEDTDATVETLRAWNMSEVVINAVVAVTHKDDDEPDDIYLAQVAAGGRLAILTKRYDRLDNIKSLRNAPADFRNRKFGEILAAQTIWYNIDPETGSLIIKALEEYLPGSDS